VPFTRGSAISRRGLLAGALGTAAAVGLAACSPGSAGKPGTQQSVAGSGGADTYDGPAVALAYWNGLTGGDGPIMKKMMTDFNAAHPNIKVSMTATPWVDYYAKLPAAVSNGKGPDIGIMHEYSLATNAARQVIQPLDDVATALDMKERTSTRRSGRRVCTRARVPRPRSGSAFPWTCTRAASTSTRPFSRRSAKIPRRRRPR
jgi:multiple sugar transport system substrate-binding protein